MGHDDVRAAVRPLRWIFWGGLLCVIDVHYSTVTDGRGWRFDVLNDVVGMALILAGLVRLLAVRVHDRYATVLRVCIAVAVLELLDAVREHVIQPWPESVRVAVAVLQLLAFASTALFCVAMRWMCDAHGLPEASRSWRTTLLLFLVVWLIPLGGVQIAVLVAMATGSPWQMDLGSAVALFVLLVLVMLVPLVHFFVSTSRTARAAEGAVPAMPDPDVA
ncbi:MAG: hypothetical protein U1E39_10640 [Planctomycetota bacterium]